jgi:hypothetical protein
VTAGTRTAKVTVKLADLEPINGFIVKVCRAEAWFRGLTPDELLALPENALAGVTLLQAALRDIAGHLPTKAEITADTTETRTT